MKDEILNYLNAVGSLIWVDTLIEPGQRWRDEIESSLSATRLALLLISQNFLVSDFIMKNEVPAILKAEPHGVKIIGVILSYSHLEPFPELRALQMINPDNVPLSAMPKPQREKVLVQLAETVYNEVNPLS